MEANKSEQLPMSSGDASFSEQLNDNMPSMQLMQSQQQQLEAQQPALAEPQCMSVPGIMSCYDSFDSIADDLFMTSLSPSSSTLFASLSLDLDMDMPADYPLTRQQPQAQAHQHQHQQSLQTYNAQQESTFIDISNNFVPTIGCVGGGGSEPSAKNDALCNTIAHQFAASFTSSSPSSSSASSSSPSSLDVKSSSSCCIASSNNNSGSSSSNFHPSCHQGMSIKHDASVGTDPAMIGRDLRYKREFEWTDNSRLLETQHSATQHHHHHQQQQQQQHHQFHQQHQRYFTLQQTAHQQPTTPRHMQFATSCVQLTSANTNRSALAHQHQQQQQQQQESCNLEKEKESFKLVEKLQPKKSRTKYTKDQLELLETSYRSNAYPDMMTVETLCKTLSINKEKINIWFQNRRARNKRAVGSSPSSFFNASSSSN